MSDARAARGGVPAAELPRPRRARAGSTRWLERGLGGITLFAYNVRDPEQLAGLTAALRAERPELLISIDEEGGDVTRLEAEHGSSYPGNLALGAVDDVALTEEVASAIAGELARAGVNLNLAPVADTNTNPRNPVIGVRSFGSDPELVARHVAAFVTGTQRQGVAACAKHFPGHGDTAVDSHRELPTVGGDLAAALLPFRAAIAAGVQAVMTGHLLVPGLDEAPATISRPILSGLLRGELGFDGLIVTDALEMQGISRTRRACRKPRCSLSPPAPTRSASATTCTRRRSSRSTPRSSTPSAPAGCRRSASPTRRSASHAICRWTSPTAAGAPGREVGAEAARQSARVAGDVAVAGPFLVLELVPEANIAAGEALHGLADVLPDAVAVRLDEEPADLAALLAAHEGRRLVVVARDAARHPWQEATVAAARTVRPDAIVVETGIPGGVSVDRHTRRRPREPRRGRGSASG